MRHRYVGDAAVGQRISSRHDLAVPDEQRCSHPMQSAMVLAIVLLATSIARADDVTTPDGTIEGVAIDAARRPIGGTTVRIVGEALVMTVRADRDGRVRVTHLPPGTYRIEVDRGTFRAPSPVIRVDYGRKSLRSCWVAMDYSRRIQAGHRSAPPPPPPPALIDTRSTSLGVRLGRRDLVGPTAR